MTKLYIDHQTDTRIILAVDHGGKHWEIDVTIDADEDGGILAGIGREFRSLHVLRIWLDRKALQRAAGLAAYRPRRIVRRGRFFLIT